MCIAIYRDNYDNKYELIATKRKMKQLIIILTFLISSTTLFAQEMPDDQYMDAYIVIADTSQDYYELRDKMFDLADILQLEIDTMGRGFDKSKNLICLPEDNEDEIYAGDYAPRRYPSDQLSLEYLAVYMDGAKPTGETIALVTTITDEKEKADKTLTKIKKYIPSAYIVQASLYMGCLH